MFIAIDLFLLEGFSAFIRVCLALLKLIESNYNNLFINYDAGELFELSFDESLVYLKTFGRHLETDVEVFYEIAMSFKITKQMCRDLEKFYQQESTRYDVEFD